MFNPRKPLNSRSQRVAADWVLVTSKDIHTDVDPRSIKGRLINALTSQHRLAEESDQRGSYLICGLHDTGDNIVNPSPSFKGLTTPLFPWLPFELLSLPMFSTWEPLYRGLDNYLHYLSCFRAPYYHYMVSYAQQPHSRYYIRPVYYLFYISLLSSSCSRNGIHFLDLLATSRI